MACAEHRVWLGAWLLAVLLWALGAPAVAAPPPLTEATVVAVYPDEGRVLLRHGDMPHLGMSAMTMEFVASDKRWLRGLQPGAVVRFDARREGEEHVITRWRRR